MINMFGAIRSLKLWKFEFEGVSFLLMHYMSNLGLVRRSDVERSHRVKSYYSNNRYYLTWFYIMHGFPPSHSLKMLRLLNLKPTSPRVVHSCLVSWRSTKLKKLKYLCKMHGSWEFKAAS
jgi:hypothetical protein